ncbi:hypothetical protein HGA13_07860 [Nocardia speluncae]|uniref:Adenylate kinase n=1 Tax=Nocardia speluncae TaxID=419477 RepID=A0A846XAE8_9NOCA|nr:hypothetical protein [Nocardia speluncae]NKY32988.1 hypothetical protein [Nocardia speluncae]
MTLSIVVPILGPPAAGKTTLTLALETDLRRRIFRLREHVPADALAAAASAASRVGWIDDSIVRPAVHNYLEQVCADDLVDTVLLDNFPGTAEQVSMLIDSVGAVAPQCVVEPLELAVDERTRRSRAKNRRVCYHCEKDPIADPRLPATAAAQSAWTCGRCGGQLHPRRGDAPSLFAARSRRHQSATDAIRAAFISAGYPVTTLDANPTPDTMAGYVEPMLISRRRTA